VRADVSALRGAFHGTVVTPSNPEYEAARVLFNTRIRTRPVVICRCADTDDVVAAVRFAREADLPIAIRGGGHHACGFSLVDEGVVIDVGSMKRVSFDPGTATAVVEPGCGWRDLDRITYVDFTTDGEAGLPHGYAAPGGECPTVSNAGYSLGGGYGLISRRYGLACDHIVEAEVVNADGRVLRAAEDENPDLLWALRGAGGGGFGVVSKLKYRLDAVPKTVFGGVIAWPIEQAEAVLRAYRDLYVDSDDDRVALFMALTTDPYPEGPMVLVVYGLYVGPPAEAPERLAPLRSLGQPLFDAFGTTSYYDLQQTLGDEIVYGLQSKWRGGYFTDGGFSDDAFSCLVDGFQRSPSGFSMIRFDLLGGGAVARVPGDATAFAHRGSLFYASIISQWAQDSSADANLEWTDTLLADLQPFLNSEVYQNYADEDLADWAGAYYGANYPRLREVKQRYDPTDFFRHRQSIQPAG
jgi:FAD/FMN-containing dehydrogenase